jgi:hypothetical protein
MNYIELNEIGGDFMRHWQTANQPIEAHMLRGTGAWLRAHRSMRLGTQLILARDHRSKEADQIRRANPAWRVGVIGGLL